jgi:hypothetical protein
MSKRRKILLVVILLVVGIQLVPVPRENPPVTAPVAAPDDVRAVLENSCYDCHSNLTKWPWYSRVAPASWLVYKDVTKGRDELNFSEWGEYSDRRRDHKLEELEEFVTDKKMPLPIYLRLHPEAALSVAAAETLIGWSRAERAALGIVPEEE